MDKMVKMKTIKLFDVRDHDGKVIGSFVREVSARELWEMRIMRKLFQDTIDSCKNTFKVPILEDEKVKK
jgi:hypothetical protein